MNANKLKPGEWVSVYRTYKDFQGNEVSGWFKATFVRKYGDDKIVAIVQHKGGSNVYSRWRKENGKARNDA